SLALDELARLLSVLVQEAVERSSQVKFAGLRRQVTASDLLDSGIIDKETLDHLVQGSKTVQEVTEMASVKRYLDGTGCIAGVMVPSKTDPQKMEKMSIYQANVTRFECRKQELIVKEHGIRLLEAQIATGGIIDPVHSHRLPVEAAYKRGYFDQEMNQILSDPSDDTKGFFDPNTHENLTYMQLLRRCVPDPDTGLYFLQEHMSAPGLSEVILVKDVIIFLIRA
ncbi:PREDICTED: plectin-like, partial [Merops nubicus]|uniref:plectin-like n=1 Tax=Merops nubicus TaxID=57421 RepID=UPI0004F08756